MSWIVESKLTWFQRFCFNVVKAGPIPKHIAIIMDGNRRFAKKVVNQGDFGHGKGFDKLAETLQWCLELGVKEVTVYAFSIENFKRSKEEVNTLMDLIREKYKRLLEEKEQLMREGVRIRAIGNLNLLTPDIRKIFADIMLMTKDNNKLFLNVAVAYTSREEIVNAVSTVVDGVHSGLIEEIDIDEEVLSSCLYTDKLKNPDLLIRTSGETRLSDFLLWQIKYTDIFFANVLWPEFGIWHLLATVVKYQRSSGRTVTEPSLPRGSRVDKFLENVENSRWLQIEQHAAVKV